MIKLICKAVVFYSLGDEDLFFEGIKRIKSIQKIEGVHDELHLYVKSKNILRKDLMNLIALFYRYKIDMKQLSLFLNKKNEKWFKESKGYWVKEIFG